ncbi:MAG: phosphotransferase family protein [Caulobacter sp.]|nr:phosphotransferase family protein [Caulobacter sp.]
MSADLKEGLEAYLTALWGAPAAVTNLSRIPGGASRETYRLDADIGGVTRGMILRRDPPGSLIDTDRRLEFLAYRTVHGHVPAPQAIALEETGGALERPFFLMERIDGGVVPSPFVFDPYGQHAEALGREFFTTLGRLAALDHAGTPLSEVAPAPAAQDCWRVALDHWSAVIEADEQHPQPIVRAAIRWLARHPPPPAQRVSIVHGDYRTGNFLHDGAGKILAILDWEMAHLGDPLEDLGWAFDPLWNHFDEGKVGGMVPRETAIALWEAASGLKVDPAALEWWSLFNAVKGQAIWTSAAKEYRDGGFTDPVLAISGWYTARRQDQILAARLARLEAI